MAKVSIIIPVYNVEKFIGKCTQSLLAQTLDDMEVFFVDDHCPDNSMEVARQCVADSPRKDQFHFIQTPHNMGAGMARNYALPQTTGEYIAFVDSDDWVEPTMFEDLYERARKNDSDLCYCQAIKDFDDGKSSEILKNPDMAEGEITHDKRAFFLTHYVSLFWTFIYKRSLIMDNDIRYPEERCADDSFFVSCCLFTAQSSAHVDKPFYHYLIRANSIVTTKNPTKYKKRITVFNKLMDFAKNKGVYEEFKPEIDFLYIKKGYLVSAFNYVMNVDKPCKEELKRIQQEVEQLIPGYRQNCYFCQNKAARFSDFMVGTMPSLALLLVPVYVKHTGALV
jgi:glycosyltransferase involved in cell wall biosynthesis